MSDYELRAILRLFLSSEISLQTASELTNIPKDVLLVMDYLLDNHHVTGSVDFTEWVLSKWNPNFEAIASDYD
jgi:hypothetical protein